jgi:hypothetical protein
VIVSKSSVDYWADWLVDAVATATQDRRFLRGDPAEDTVATEALLLNGKKAMENLLRYREQQAPADAKEKDDEDWDHRTVGKASFFNPRN